MTNQTPTPTYRAHICIEFTSPHMDPELEADELTKDIADLFSASPDIKVSSVWLDDLTEPDQGTTP